MTRKLEKLPIVGEKLGALKNFIKEEIEGGFDYLSNPETLTNLKKYMGTGVVDVGDGVYIKKQ